MEPYLNQPFELFFDVTAMASDCELPINWLNQFFQLAFSERSDNMVSLYLLNAGFFSQRYARKLPRLLTNKLVKRCRLGISTREFHTWISSSELRLPKETCKYIDFKIDDCAYILF
jgi:neurofibromin 1